MLRYSALWPFIRNDPLFLYFSTFAVQTDSIFLFIFTYLFSVALLTLFFLFLPVSCHTCIANAKCIFNCKPTGTHVFRHTRMVHARVQEFKRVLRPFKDTKCSPFKVDQSALMWKFGILYINLLYWCVTLLYLHWNMTCHESLCWIFLQLIF